MKITEVLINQLKAKHGDIFLIEVPKNNEGELVQGVFRKPDLKALGASAQVADKDPIKSGNILYNYCFLDGDEEFKTNDEVRLSALQQFKEIFTIRQATIKKL